MSVKVENSFLVPASVEQAWTILTDLPRVAPCLPGAEITEIVDATTYRGRARVKIGPIELGFQGEARLHDVDPQLRTSRLTARGGDAKGRGSVHSQMRFALAGEGDHTRVHVHTELILAGSVAQYGRASGVVREVCNQLAAQFARNLAALIEGAGASTPSSAVSLSAWYPARCRAWSSAALEPTGRCSTG
ncbi:MAG: SRPBCC family protein [Burkholderiales bacterium]|nr:SRPBCC family protein [Burkholderiales bacterium]